jgi:U3 small nucleolar RNA-associated protein 19
LRALADKDKDQKDLNEQEDGQGEEGPTTKSTRTATLLKLLMLVVLEKSEADMIQFWVSFGGEEGDGTLVPRPEEEEEEGTEENAQEQQEEAEEEDDDDLMDFGYGDGDDEDDCDDDAQGEEETAGAGGASGKEKIPHVAQLSAHRKALGEAWVACLRLPGFTPHLYRSTTQFVARHVIEAMASPLQLADFLTTSYAQGGLTSLVALEGLFVLMQVHNLEYPRFYASLYRLLSPQVLFSRHRPRFFRLLRLCLQSTHVPAHVVAAFLKKLSRLALQAPPPSIIFVLSLVIIVLRKHPACQALLHRTLDLGALAGARETDTFDPTAEDPALALKQQQQQQEGKTEGEGKGSQKGKGKGKGKGGKEKEKNSSAISGIQTSLWEVAALQSHYHPAVATLAKGLETSQPEDPKTLNPYSTNMDEFASYSYADLFAHETKRRRVKKEVPLAYENVRAQQLFQPGDVFEGIFALPSTSAVAVASAPASL